MEQQPGLFKTLKPLPHIRALAHLGDAVYELWIRELAVTLCQKSKDLHRYTTERVNAETQSLLLEKLTPQLSNELLDIVRRAQNLPVASNRRSNHAVHRKATAFEALIGYWYLLEPETISEHREQILQILAGLEL